MKLFPLTLLSLLVVACGNLTPGGANRHECVKNDDCGTGMVCSDKKCVLADDNGDGTTVITPQNPSGSSSPLTATLPCNGAGIATSLSDAALGFGCIGANDSAGAADHVQLLVLGSKTGKVGGEAVKLAGTGLATLAATADAGSSASIAVYGENASTHPLSSGVSGLGQIGVSGLGAKSGVVGATTSNDDNASFGVTGLANGDKASGVVGHNANTAGHAVRSNGLFGVYDETGAHLVFGATRHGLYDIPMAVVAQDAVLSATHVQFSGGNVDMAGANHVELPIKVFAHSTYNATWTAGSTQSFGVACDAGYTALAGGCENSIPTITLIASQRINADSWRCTYRNDGAGTMSASLNSFKVTATCLKAEAISVTNK